MADYVKQQWRDGDGSTPLSASRLNKLEDGIGGAHSRVAGVEKRTRRLAPTPDASVDVKAIVDRNRSSIVANQPYREPTAEEVAAVIDGVGRIIRGDLTVDLSAHGFTLTTGWDESARKNVIVLDAEKGTERCWGTYVFPVDAPVHCLIQAPHPVFDGGSDVIAHRIWQDGPDGTCLFVSGSHRTDPSGDNPRDVAHQPGSMWHKVSEWFALQGIKMIQQHGYADASAPDADVIVSEGAATPSQDILSLALAVERNGFRVARHWDGTAKTLAGTINSCGDIAKAVGGTFAHIEMNNTSRTTRLDAYVASVAASGYLHGKGSTLLTDDFPKPVGSVNGKGTANTAARADHTHRLAQNDPVDGDVLARLQGGWRAAAPVSLGFATTDQLATVTQAANTAKTTADQALSQAQSGGYVKPSAGIPVSDLEARAQTVVTKSEAATYQATKNTLMLRNSTGAVSVGDPTTTTHAVPKAVMDAAIAAATQPLIDRIAVLEQKANGST